MRLILGSIRYSQNTECYDNLVSQGLWVKFSSCCIHAINFKYVVILHPTNKIVSMHATYPWNGLGKLRPACTFFKCDAI